MIDNTYGTQLLSRWDDTQGHVRVTRTIVIEGPPSWVATTLDRALCQGVGDARWQSSGEGRRIYSTSEVIERV
jgi:hypothetical protein